ncbi:MAG: hypothetical protein ACOY4I_11660 [Bacillota bacterium]
MEISAIFKKFLKLMKGIFVKNEISRIARLYHVDFNYGLVPNTAINDFNNMSKINSLYSGDCYIYLFEKPHFQGWYSIIKPGERLETDVCGSIIISIEPISINEAQKAGRVPGCCWEMSGPMYLLHFYAAYRYM